MKIYLPGQRDKFQNYYTALSALGAQVQATAPEECAALLLPGGCDVEPRRYGQEICGSREIDVERDAREWAALEQFVADGRPVLGVCRGMQLINVYFGGSLHQDIPGHKKDGEVGDPLDDPRHPAVTEDPVLQALYGERFTVNSLHHQSVDRLGDSLRAVMWADDGTVEGIRHDTLPVLGVQWHPERLRTPIDGWLLLARWLLQ